MYRGIKGVPLTGNASTPLPSTMRLSLFLILIVAAACCEGCRPLPMIPDADLNREFPGVKFSQADFSNGYEAVCNNGGLLHFKTVNGYKIEVARGVRCDGGWKALIGYKEKPYVTAVACSKN